jgi:carboxypeptidase-like protein
LKLLNIQNYILKFGLFVAFFAIYGYSLAQGGKKIVQLTGIIVNEDSVGLPGAHIYVPKSGRGTSSNIYGYFSLPVLAYDSILISYIGYEMQHYLVPDDQGESITLVIKLIQDTRELETIEVFPFPSEELFKEAVLALRLPEEREYDLRDLYGDEVMAKMLMNTPYDGAMNFRYYQDLQFDYIHSQYGYIQNPYLNPFNWAKFIQDLKKKKNKR